jgi:ferredoxin
VKLVIDSSVCQGHGRCYRLAPDVLGYDDEGYVTPQGEVAFPSDQAALAEEIVGTCPEGAISLIED